MRTSEKDGIRRVFAVLEASLRFYSKLEFYPGVVHFVGVLVDLVENTGPTSLSFRA